MQGVQGREGCCERLRAGHGMAIVIINSHHP